jgi:hypothetical protein
VDEGRVEILLVLLIQVLVLLLLLVLLVMVLLFDSRLSVRGKTGLKHWQLHCATPCRLGKQTPVEMFSTRMAERNKEHAHGSRVSQPRISGWFTDLENFLNSAHSWLLLSLISFSRRSWVATLPWPPKNKFLASTSARVLLDFPSLNWDMILAGLELDEAESGVAEPLPSIFISVGIAISGATLPESANTAVSSVEFWGSKDARLPAMQPSPLLIAWASLSLLQRHVHRPLGLGTHCTPKYLILNPFARFFQLWGNVRTFN